MKGFDCDRCGEKGRDEVEFKVLDSKNICPQCIIVYDGIYKRSRIAQRTILKEWYDSLGVDFVVDIFLETRRDGFKFN